MRLQKRRATRFAAWAVLFSFGLQIDASAVTIDWTFIGDPGNACDPQSDGCYGAVSYAYSIGTYEVTNAQYAEFLNAKATLDPFNLYHPLMGNVASHGGIARTGTPGGPYGYSAIPGREDMPVDFVSFYDAARFANWMHNGQGNGDTETGAYSMLGEAIPSNGPVTRNPGAVVSCPARTSGTRRRTTTASAPGTSTSPHATACSPDARRRPRPATARTATTPSAT